MAIRSPSQSILCASQMMAQWYPMDKAGAYYLATHEKVTAAWVEGMLSLTQLMLHEEGVAVEERQAIKGYMFRCVLRSP